MKWLSILIALGFLGVSFSYVWANKTEALVMDSGMVLFINKWTGEHCTYVPTERARDNVVSLIDLCWVDRDEMELP